MEKMRDLLIIGASRVALYQFQIALNTECILDSATDFSDSLPNSLSNRLNEGPNGPCQLCMLRYDVLCFPCHKLSHCNHGPVNGIDVSSHHRLKCSYKMGTCNDWINGLMWTSAVTTLPSNDQSESVRPD